MSLYKPNPWEFYQSQSGKSAYYILALVAILKVMLYGSLKAYRIIEHLMPL